MTAFSKDIKELIIKKVLEGQSKPILAKEYNMSVKTIDNWMRTQFGPARDKTPKPLNWPLEKKLEALIETSKMTEEQKTLYCREHGLYPAQIHQWRYNFLHMDKKVHLEALKDQKKINLQQKIQIERQQKALAEAAALLLLKKKADSYWGGSQDD
jgi:transposase-like protein